MRILFIPQNLYVLSCLAVTESSFTGHLYPLAADVILFVSFIEVDIFYS